jgi:hypothetical protein
MITDTKNAGTRNYLSGQIVKIGRYTHTIICLWLKQAFAEF